MPGEVIPTNDKALLEAQAMAGPAGVQAYQAARNSLAASSGQTMNSAMTAAQGRGGPDGAMQSALAGTAGLVSERDAALQAAQSRAQLAADQRSSRNDSYNLAVQEARGLIQDQAWQTVQPIRAESDYQLARIRQQGQANVNSIEAQIALDTARYEAEARARAQEAAIEQERWEREMAARRAASAGSGGGFSPISTSELTGVLQAAGLDALEAAYAQAQELLPDDAELHKAISTEAAARFYENIATNGFQGMISPEAATNIMEQPVTMPGTMAPNPDAVTYGGGITEDDQLSSFIERLAESRRQYADENAIDGLPFDIAANSRQSLIPFLMSQQGMQTPGLANILGSVANTGMPVRDSQDLAVAMGLERPEVPMPNDFMRTREIPYTGPLVQGPDPLTGDPLQTAPPPTVETYFADNAFQRSMRQQAGRVPQIGSTEEVLKAAMEASLPGVNDMLALDGLGMERSALVQAFNDTSGDYRELRGQDSGLADYLEAQDTVAGEQVNSYLDGLEDSEQKYREDVRWQNYLSDRELAAQDRAQRDYEDQATYVNEQEQAEAEMAYNALIPVLGVTPNDLGFSNELEALDVLTDNSSGASILDQFDLAIQNITAQGFGRDQAIRYLSEQGITPYGDTAVLYALIEAALLPNQSRQDLTNQLTYDVPET